MNSHVLSAQRFEYTYAGGHHAVRGIDLSIREGEIYALLGTNGAGKSTTLEMVEGFRQPTAGRVTVFGGDPRDRAQTRPQMGIMLQEAGFAADATVAESVRLAGALSGRSDTVERVPDTVGLAEKARTRVGQVSGGERRRLDFACASWGSPRLLFLDEPTTGLDPSARAQLWEAVLDLQARGTTIVLTTHYLEEAERYANRIGVMRAGQLLREGTVSELARGSSTTIRFTMPRDPAATANLPLPFTAAEAGTAVITTENPQADMARLLAWATEAQVTLADLRVEAASLNDLFTDLATTNS
ncbi:ABC transporter ATP-binding protein [Micrococcales bacterium 31B]|nr:ABC transporter ATP-binding protein [Micrococcales bacterium 31B]